MQFDTCETSKAPGRPKGSVSILPRRRASRAEEVSLPEQARVVDSASLNQLNAGIWARKEDAADKTRQPGKRRLRELTPQQIRTLESRLYFARRVHKWSDVRISHELDLHPEDLDALAAMAGSR